MTDLPEDDTTIRVRRSWLGEPPGLSEAESGLDETTAVSRRRAAAHPEPARPRRSTFIDGPIDAEEFTDGSTIIARRESRRRASREHPPEHMSDAAPVAARPTSSAPTIAPETPGAAAGRAAHSPDGETETYGVRRSQPAVAARLDLRSEATTRPHQAPADGASAQSRRRQNDRRATFIVVGTASAIAVAAASALIAIVLSL